MRIAYFDTISGVSGDMTLGAFVSAGVPIETLSREINKLNLDGIELHASHITRSGISAVKVDVVISRKPEPRRRLKDIFLIIDESALSDRIKQRSKKIFIEVAKAEAKIHRSSIEEIHFHEVGALDSIVDIVGTAICLDLLNIDFVYSSPVKLGGGGFVETEHGKLPLPAPATAEILRGYATILTDIPYELTTPTGAAIIKAMSSGTLGTAQLKVQSIGYGAGARELSQIPNLLRIMVGDLLPGYAYDEVILVDTNIDDMNPEIYPFVIEQLLSAGACDAHLVPIIMKKGRPGILLSVIVSRSHLEGILEVLFSQTTTLGVRMQSIERRKVHRSQREVDTSLGKVKMKVVISDEGERLVPEYEECKRISVAKGMPLIEIYRVLEREALGKTREA